MSKYACLAVVVAIIAPICAASAQEGAKKSTSSGFFVGLGAEGASIMTNDDAKTTDSGGGAGIVLGYGFSTRWSLYGQLSGATINAGESDDTYSLGHVDVGARVHFRAGRNVVVPFLQFGLSARGVSQDVNGVTVRGSGGALSFGAGLNAHFTPKVAFSSAVTWSVGNFDRFQVGNLVTGNFSVTATTTRLHVGLLWFPGA